MDVKDLTLAHVKSHLQVIPNPIKSLLPGVLASNPHSRFFFYLLVSFLFESDRKANAVTPELVKKLPFLEVVGERESEASVWGCV